MLRKPVYKKSVTMERNTFHRKPTADKLSSSEACWLKIPNKVLRELGIKIGSHSTQISVTLTNTDIENGHKALDVELE